MSGTFTSTLNLIRQGIVKGSTVYFGVALTFIGASLGTSKIQ